MMARFIIQKRAKKVSDLYDFKNGNYQYVPEESNQEELVFLRDHQS